MWHTKMAKLAIINILMFAWISKGNSSQEIPRIFDIIPPESNECLHPHCRWYGDKPLPWLEALDYLCKEDQYPDLAALHKNSILLMKDGNLIYWIILIFMVMIEIFIMVEAAANPNLWFGYVFNIRRNIFAFLKWWKLKIWRQRSLMLWIKAGYQRVGKAVAFLSIRRSNKRIMIIFIKI